VPKRPTSRTWLRCVSGENRRTFIGMILARCLEASTSIVEALQRYEAARLDRTSRIVQTAFDRLERTRDELADPNLAKAFMERLTASGDPYDWIYQYDAVSVPV
jgi:salicylate hydroxylase